jgi:hypothetical protein
LEPEMSKFPLAAPAEKRPLPQRTVEDRPAALNRVNIEEDLQLTMTKMI